MPTSYSCKLSSKVGVNHSSSVQSQPPPPPPPPPAKKKKKAPKKKSPKKRKINTVESKDAAKKPTADERAVSEMQLRMNKAKAAAGPILFDPLAVLENANRDVATLTMTQLEGETIRLEARGKAVRTRMEHLMATRGKGAAANNNKRRARKLCGTEGCTHIAQKGGVCKSHGAPYRYKRCSSEGCERKAQTGGVCYSHGAPYRLCKIEGCKNKVQQGGLCCRHGAKVRKCSADGCANNAQKGGLCQGHNKELRMYNELDDNNNHDGNDIGEEEEEEEVVWP